MEIPRTSGVDFSHNPHLKDYEKDYPFTPERIEIQKLKGNSDKIKEHVYFPRNMRNIINF